MRKTVAAIVLCWSCALNAQPVKPQQYRQDFEFFWQTIHDNYSYFDTKQTDWNNVRERYAPIADTVSSRSSFVALLEKVLYELYDHHCTLGTNTPISRRLVPTGADIWAEYDKNGVAKIIEVRKGFGAENSGIMAGMEIVAVNDAPVDKAIVPFLAHTIDPEAKNFALRLLLAGDHVTKRKITARYKNKTIDFYPDRDGMMLENFSYSTLVESKQFGKTGYIRVNNCLFDNDLIKAFDSVLNLYSKSSAIILDLRETPSGGNSSVARAILGRFISKAKFYQQHEYVAEEKETGIKRSWQEIVSPRPPVYDKQLVVLADHWTGSMGEGIVIGFDGMKRSTTIGTKLARLIGATNSFELPNTHISFHIPVEKLFHIKGSPREHFFPLIPVDLAAQRTGNDSILQRALLFLQARPH